MVWSWAVPAHTFKLIYKTAKEINVKQKNTF